MEDTAYKPVGGVARVALYPTYADFGGRSPGGVCEATFDCEPGEVPLTDDRSSFVELLDNSSGPLSVTHTLTLVAERGEASKGLSAEFADSLSRQGGIADVTLNDGRRLIVGCSERMERDFPLRFVSLHSDSGRRLSDTPTLTLTLRSTDTAPAMPLVVRGTAG